jgi:hypothetical protein
VLLTAERDASIRRAIGLLAASVQEGLTEVDRLAVGIKEIRKLRHGKQFGWALGDIAGGAQSFAEIDIVRLCREAGLQPPNRQTRRRDKDGRWRYLDLEWVLLLAPPCSGAPRSRSGSARATCWTTSGRSAYPAWTPIRLGQTPVCARREP